MVDDEGLHSRKVFGNQLEDGRGGEGGDLGAYAADDDSFVLRRLHEI